MYEPFLFKLVIKRNLFLLGYFLETTLMSIVDHSLILTVQIKREDRVSFEYEHFIFSIGNVEQCLIGTTTTTYRVAQWQ